MHVTRIVMRLPAGTMRSIEKLSSYEFNVEVSIG